MQEKIIFDLTKPIKSHLNINGKNEIIDLDKLYLIAPTYKQKEQTKVVKQMFLLAHRGWSINMISLQKAVEESRAIQKAIQDTSTKVENSEAQQVEQTFDYKQIKDVLFTSGTSFLNITAFFEKFRELLISNICFKDEDLKQSIKIGELQLLDDTDEENLVAKYIEFFFMDLWMKTI